jgi:hypothetical protein
MGRTTLIRATYTSAFSSSRRREHCRNGAKKLPALNSHLEAPSDEANENAIDTSARALDVDFLVSARAQFVQSEIGLSILAQSCFHLADTRPLQIL